MGDLKKLLFCATLAFGLFAVCLPFVTCQQEKNYRPIIGLLTQVAYSPLSKFGPTYLAASYVDFIESGGGRVVPILINQTEEYYNTLFKSINGLLLPGGGANIDSRYGYSEAARIMYDLAIKANDAGDYFPIFGTCLGFEELMIITAGSDITKGGFNAHEVNFPVILEPGYENSRLLNKSTTPASIIKTLTTENSTYNSHHFGVTPTNFTKSAALKSFFQVLSTNYDLNGVKFISMVEAFHYPIYATQWHPEKNAFEFRIDACHTEDCVQLMQFFANFYVEEGRKSMHHFPTKEEESKHLIYNYNPVYLVNVSSSFTEAYFFTP